MSTLADQLADTLRAETVAQQQASEAFRAAQTSTSAKVQSVYDEILASMSRPKVPELPDEIKQINAILLSQPRLIAAVQKFLEAKVSAINAAVASVLEEA